MNLIGEPVYAEYGVSMASVSTVKNQSTSQQLNALSGFYEPVLPYLQGVKTRIQVIVPPESQLLSESLRHALVGGGKLLRPVVTMLASAATCTNGQQVSSKHEEIAAVAEMIHVATLLHDDVLDDADLRRGKKTVRAGWGNSISILSGDYLLAQASRKLAEVGNIRVVSIFSDVLADLCDGEVEQIRTSYNLDVVDWDSYFRKSVCKTATLFAAGCESAAVLNRLPEAEVQALRSYGKNFGIAFQIVDDLLDYTSSQADMGKPVLDDLKNGIVNAPVLLALESQVLSEEKRKTLREAVVRVFGANLGESSGAGAQVDVDKASCDVTVDVQMVRALLEEANAIEETQAMAEGFVRDALQGLSFVPPSVERDALEGLCSFIIKRKS